MITPDAIVAEARAWLGTPFHHQQSLKGVGCDCIGLVAGVAEALGVPEAAAWKADPLFRGYGREPNPRRLLEACAKYLDEIPLQAVRLGDILQFTFVREPMHFAIVSQLDPRYVVHSYSRAARVVENGAKASFWKLLRAYRYKGLA